MRPVRGAAHFCYRKTTSVARFCEPVGYAAAGGPNQVVSASVSPRWADSPTQATYPSGRINTAVGAMTGPIVGSSHAPTYLGVDRLNAVGPWSDVESAGLTEVEERRTGVEQQGEDAQRTVGRRSDLDRVCDGPAAGDLRQDRSEYRDQTSSQRIVCEVRPSGAAHTIISRKALTRSSGRRSR